MKKSDSKPAPDIKLVELCKIICEELKKGISKHFDKFYKKNIEQFRVFAQFKVYNINRIDEALQNFWIEILNKNIFCHVMDKAKLKSKLRAKSFFYKILYLFTTIL